MAIEIPDDLFAADYDIGTGEVSGIIRSAAEKYGVDPDVMESLAWRESSLNPAARNPHSSAGGLFQFVDATWKDYGGGADKFDPVANADAAARMLRENLDRFGGDYDLALAAHHVGPGKARQALADAKVGDRDVGTQDWLRDIKTHAGGGGGAGGGVPSAGEQSEYDMLKRIAKSYGQFEEAAEPEAPKGRGWAAALEDILRETASGGQAIPSTFGALDAAMKSPTGIGGGPFGAAAQALYTGGQAAAGVARGLALKARALFGAEDAGDISPAQAMFDAGQAVREATVGKDFEKLSPQRQEERQASLGRIAEAERTGGQVGAMFSAAKEFATDPEQWLEQLPNLVLMRGLGKLGGVGGAIGGGAVLQGGDVVGDFRQQMDEAPLAAFENSPDFQMLVAEGTAPEVARQQVTDKYTRLVFAAATGGSVLANTLVPGGSSLEQALAGGVGKVTARSVAKATAGEAVGEALEEGALGQLPANLAQREAISPELDVFRGVGSATGAGLAMGGLMGGGSQSLAGVIHNLKTRQEAQIADKQQAAQDLQEAPDVDTAVAAFERTVQPIAGFDFDAESLLRNASPEDLAAAIDEAQQAVTAYHTGIADTLRNEAFEAPEDMTGYAEGTTVPERVRHLLTADEASGNRILESLPAEEQATTVAALADALSAMDEDSLRAAGGYATDVALQQRGRQAKEQAFSQAKEAELRRARQVAGEAERGILEPTRDVEVERATLLAELAGVNAGTPTAMAQAFGQARPDLQAQRRAAEVAKARGLQETRTQAQARLQQTAENEQGQFSVAREGVPSAVEIEALETPVEQRGAGQISGRPAAEFSDAELRAQFPQATGSTRNAIAHEMTVRGIAPEAPVAQAPARVAPTVMVEQGQDQASNTVAAILMQRGGAQRVTATTVDPATLANPPADVGAAGVLAKLFKKKVVWFQATEHAADGSTKRSGVGGFVRGGDASTIYLNVDSAESVVAVVSHEILHMLKSQHAEIYEMLRKKVQADFAAYPEQFAKFRKYYGETSNLGEEDLLEEAIADALGNQAMDPKFWANVFARVAAKHGNVKAKGIIARLRDALARLISNVVAEFQGRKGYVNFVTDLESIGEAFEEAAAKYVEAVRTGAAEVAGETRFTEARRIGPYTSRRGAELSQQMQKQATSIVEENGQFYLEPTNEPATQVAPRAAPAPGATVAPQPIREGAGRTYRGEVPSYGEPREHSIAVVGTRYSKSTRDRLTGDHYGKGIPGDEAKRLEGADSRLRQRLYFYVDLGQGVHPEPGLGPNAQEVSLRNVYDLTADPLRLLQRDKNAMELSILEAGFDGYLNRNFGKQGAVVLLGTHSVPVVTVGQGPLAPSGRQTPPPQYTPERQLAQRLVAAKGLPGGEMAARRWGRLLEATHPDIFAALDKAGLFNSDEVLYKDELAGQYLRQATVKASAARRAGPETTLGTRVPTSKKIAKPGATEALLSDFPTLAQEPRLLNKILGELAKEPGMAVEPGLSTEEQTSLQLGRMKENLLWLFDRVPSEIRQRSKLWYEGAEKIARTWAARYDITRSQAAGVLAVLSPQKDWFMNVTLAERLLDIVTTRGDHRFDAKMDSVSFAFLTPEALKENSRLLKAYDAAHGKTLNQLLEAKKYLEAALWVRAYDEAYHPGEHAVVTPEGGFGRLQTTTTGESTVRAWGAFGTIGKALSIYENGSAENISEQLGGEHKVRNFYNNIFAPGDPNYATIDTHAVAAALMRPLGGNAKAVMDNLGGIGSAAATGLSGSYPFYFEAYKQAAEARGVLPREMQSITWEALRGMFTEGFKGKAANVQAIDKLWKQVDAGSMTRGQAREQAEEKAGGLRNPDWVHAEPGYQEVLQDKSYAPQRPGFIGNTMTFEVAPDPRNKALSMRWNSLAPEAQESITRKVIWHTVAKALASFNDQNFRGALVRQRGGYGADSNVSYSIQFNKRAAGVKIEDALRMVGSALRQKEMIRTSRRPFKTFRGGPADKVGAVLVKIPKDFTDTQIDALYAELRTLRQGNKVLVGGHTTSEGAMVIFNKKEWSGVDDATLATRIGDRLFGRHDVELDSLYVEFAEKGRDDYGLRAEEGAIGGHGTEPSVRARSDQLRAETDGVLGELIGEAEQGRFSEERQPGRAGAEQRATGEVSFSSSRLNNLKTAAMQARAAGEGVQAAEEALATALVAEPTPGFAVQGDLPEGGFALLGRTAGKWQISYYDAEGLPAGETTYASGKEAATNLVSRADLTTLTDEMATFSAARFVSPLHQAIGATKLESQPAGQWALWLKSNAAKVGVKADELQWSGILDWLELQGKRKVSKAEIQQYLAGNGVRINEVTFQAPDPYDVEQFLLDRNWTRDEIRGMTSEEATTFALDAGMKGMPKYQDYTLPGGENYRELLLTVPAVSEEGERLREESRALQQRAFDAQRDLTPEELAKVFELRKAAEQLVTVPAYRGPHWGKVANVVVHLRLNDRTDAGGKKVLFVEELQSDWAQEGRKKGFLGDLIRYKGTPVESGERITQNAPPKAPFVQDTKAWVALGLKQTILEAIRGGYDKVAFVNGEQSADRYDLSKQVREIDYAKNEDGTYSLLVFLSDGSNRQIPHLSEEALEDTVGKEAARKIIANEGAVPGYPAGDGVLKGVDLKVGGEGMKTFYDKIMPQVTRDVLKKLGGPELGEVQIEALTEEHRRQINEAYARGTREEVELAKARRPTMTQSGFDITPAMRAKITEKGIPLFSPPRFPTPPAATWQAPAPRQLPGVKTLFGADFDKLVYLLRDKFVDLKRVVGALGQVADKWNAYLQEELFHGRAAEATKQFISTELRPLLEDMRARGVSRNEFETYLWNRHAEERNVQIAKINPGMQDKGSGIPTADARAYLAGLPATRRAQLEALARKVDAINASTRQMLVDYGLETQDTIDAWEQAYKQYVPLRRTDTDSFDAPGGMGIGQGYTVKGAASQRAMGSELPVENILANIAQMRERTITRGEKNRVAMAMYGLALQNPNPDFWAPIKPGQDPAEVQQVLTDMGIPAAHAQNAADFPATRQVNKSTGLVETVPNAVYLSAPNVITARVNGVNRYLVLNAQDPVGLRLSESLKNLDAAQIGWLLGSIGKITRWFASVNTQYNPVFGVVNLTRDVQDAMLNLSATPLAGRQKAVVTDTAGALLGIYQDIRAMRKGHPATSRWASLWEEFQTEGGATGYREMFADADERAKAIDKEIKAMGRGAPMRAAGAVFAWLSDYNETMENAVRLSAYKNAKAAGLSKAQAASLAKNLTVNFNRKGQVASQAGLLYAFFNASAQGSARMFETLTGPAGKKIIAGGILLGAMQALLLAMSGFGDDDVPEFVKERSLVIPMPGTDKGYITIPMPLGFNVLPNIGRLTVETAMSGGKNVGKNAARMAGLLLNLFNPIGASGLTVQSISPTAFDPLVALSENRDWTGKPIARTDFNSLKPTPGHARAKDTATIWAKAISRGLNWMTGGTEYVPGGFSPTPDQIDYLFGQIGGGVAREVSKTAQVVESLATGEELPLYKVPLVGRFAGQAKGQAQEGSKFYDRITQVNEAEAEIKGRRKEGAEGHVADYIQEHPEARLVNAAEDAEKQVAKLRKKKHELVKAGASRERVRRIEEQITGVMSRFNARFEALEEMQ